jgi:hypothetical protein
MTLLEYAQFYRQLGLSVIPIPRPGGMYDGKKPTQGSSWMEFQQRHATEAELAEWFSGEMNIAIVTGAISGIVAVDLDDDPARDWWVRRRPCTDWQVKTARGFHCLYGHPGVKVENRCKLETGAGKLEIDVKADRGYIIAAPSVHKDGHTYRLCGDWDVPREQLPGFDPTWLVRPARPASQKLTSNLVRPTGDIVDRARRYLAATPRPEIGHGSDAATFTLACRLVRGFNLAEVDAEALLWEWAGGRANWTRAWVASKVRAAARYGSEPVGAYR